MVSQYKNSVIAVTNSSARLAALYFDHVIPAQVYYFPSAVAFNPTGDEDCKFARHVNQKFFDCCEEIGLSPRPDNTRKDSSYITKVNKLLDLIDKKVVWSTVTELRAMGLNAVPLFSRQQTYNILGKGEEEALEVKIIHAEIIQEENVEWEQVIELRRDESSKNALRDFRLFLYDNYSDKSVAYIHDSIEQKIQRHKDASKKHGFKLVDDFIHGR